MPDPGVVRLRDMYVRVGILALRSILVIGGAATILIGTYALVFLPVFDAAVASGIALGLAALGIGIFLGNRPNRLWWALLLGLLEIAINAYNGMTGSLGQRTVLSLSFWVAFSVAAFVLMRVQGVWKDD